MEATTTKKKNGQWANSAVKVVFFDSHSVRCSPHSPITLAKSLVFSFLLREVWAYLDPKNHLDTNVYLKQKSRISLYSLDYNIDISQ